MPIAALAFVKLYILQKNCDCCSYALYLYYAMLSVCWYHLYIWFPLRRDAYTSLV